MKKVQHLVKVLGVVLAVILLGTGRGYAADRENVETMQAYLATITQWINLVEDPTNAIGLAQHGIKDMYFGTGQPEKAEEALLEALTFVKKREVRNILRFTLAEVYQRMNQHQKSKEQFLKIIEENSVPAAPAAAQ
jgi:tetratricopeptide (TPR) repeat protein